MASLAQPLQEAAAIYLAEISHAYAPETIRSLRGDLTHYVSFISARACDPADESALVDYLDCLAMHYARSTIDRKLNALRHFFKELGCDPLAGKPCCLKIRELRRTLPMSRQNRKPFRSAQLDRILQSLGTAPIDLRDRALLLTALDSMARRSELACANIDNLNLQGAYGGAELLLRATKTGTNRNVWLSPATSASLRAWIEAADLQGGRLFRGTAGGHGRMTITEGMTGHGIYQRLARLIERAGIDRGGLSPHSLRMAGTVRLAEAGISLLAVQLAGGWQSPAMPARYARDFLPQNAGTGLLHRLSILPQAAPPT